MKTIGLIGGMSWESSDLYYQGLNQAVKQRLGGLSSSKVILYNVDFKEIEQLQRSNEWGAAGHMLADIALKLQNAGADCIALGANTMHKVADEIQRNIRVPFLHIADSTIQAIQAAQFKKVGLLGTMYTMEQDFYRNRYQQQGIDILIPNESDRKVVHDVIYKELTVGTFSSDSKKKFIEIIKQLHRDGAEGIILGCTEIGLLVQQDDINVPLFDTTQLHIAQLVDFQLA
ncbi:aspartate/glutamate racemase family protein [Acinetobacter shaoyimingii]|uniref:Aspartate/glutamate racemase family protein n=1 Tax=Acinetobacter shaoyimingii TaxID=2715164 RepID=A0A6G8RXC1_9GAMM|nr:aspartate/glutamate racemase family protein [Acinetobacter shaoyimingii]NHB57914.1 aspartate/glutamate racemase family protein [Acinetobacter shaoyimingii]QIO06511.1 aspartate/glutamate racemase family protein [Acinetobacter shaoyimingii]